MAAIGPRDSVAKGPVTHCLDVLSRKRGGASKLKKLRDAVFARRSKDFTGLEKVFEEYLFKPAGMKKEKIKLASNYLKKHWFDEDKGWWEDAQPIAETFATGMIKAIDASIRKGSKKKPIPMDCYWLVGHEDVQIVTLQSPDQVTLLFVTPAPKNRKPGKIWSEWAKVSITARDGKGKVKTNNVKKIR